MAETGWLNPGTVVSDSSYSGVSWSNPSNAAGSGGGAASATVTVSNLETEYLWADNLSASVPAGATIDGIAVRVDKQRAAGTATIEDAEVMLSIAGTLSGTDKSVGGGWSDTLLTTTYGGSSDTWGLTLSVSDVNHADFGIAIRADRTGGGAFGGAAIDWIRVNIYYTESGGDDDLTADNLLSGTPSLGTPDIGQEHDLTTSNLASGNPVLDTPDIGQEHDLTASNLVSGNPVLGTPTLTEAAGIDELTASNLVSGNPVLDTPDISQVHALNADNLVSGSPVLGTPVLGEEGDDDLVADNLASGAPILDTPDIGQVHALSADNLISGNPILGTPSMEAPDELTASDLLAGVPVLGTPILGIVSDDLIADNLLAGTPVLGTPALGIIEQTAENLLAGTPVLGTPVLSQVLTGITSLYRMPSRYWIDIEDSNGNVLGEGPLINIISWESTKKLSRIGEFSFEVPASDPRVSLINTKRIARLKGMCGGEEVELGLGVIDHIELTTASPPIVRASGGGIGVELTWRQVNQLTLKAQTETDPTDVWWYESSGDTITPLPNTYDNDTDTGSTITLDEPNADYFYIQFTAFPLAVYFTLGSFTNNYSNTVYYEYWNGSGWSVLDFEDKTVVDGKPWKQSGEVSWPDPGDATTGGWAGVTEYIIRMRIGWGQLHQVEFLEIDAVEDGPTTGDIEDIMSLAPDGWSLDTTNWYSGTANGSYKTLAEETIAEALVRFADAHQEAWRTDGREVEWLQDDTPDSGVRIVESPPDPKGAVAAGLSVLGREGLKKITDTNSEVTRLYCFGGGTGSARLSLSDSTVSPPSGYTVSTADSYIEVDGASPEIHRIQVFSDIGPDNNSEAAYEAAANELLSSGVAWLSQRQGYIAYGIPEVYGLPLTLKVGETVNVSAYRVIGSYLLYDIQEDLVVLTITLSLREGHCRLSKITVANKNRQPDSDVELISIINEEFNRYRGYPQNIDSNQVVSA